MSNLHILLHKISRRPRGVHRRLDCLISVVTKGWWTDRQLESCVLSKASAVVVWLATIEGCVLSKVVLWLATIALLGIEKHPGEIVVTPMMDYLIWSPLPTSVFLIRKSLKSKLSPVSLSSCSPAPMWQNRGGGGGGEVQLKPRHRRVVAFLNSLGNVVAMKAPLRNEVKLG